MLNGWFKVIVKYGDICNEDCDAITSTAKSNLLDLTKLGTIILSKGGP